MMRVHYVALLLVLACEGEPRRVDRYDAAPPLGDVSPATPPRDAEAIAVDGRSHAVSDSSPDVAGEGGVSVDDPPTGWIPTIVGCGYGGTRIRSKDLGATWSDRIKLKDDGVDDSTLLRALTYGKRRYAAGGVQYFVSDDGVAWLAHPLPAQCALMESLAYGNELFVATCGGHAWTSADAITYEYAGAVNASTGHVRVWFGSGEFAASGDDKRVFLSTDGKTWSERNDLVGVSFCGGRFRSEGQCGEGAYGHGVWLRDQWRGIVDRSLDQRNWTRVYADDSRNHVEHFAFGYSPP